MSGRAHNNNNNKVWWFMRSFALFNNDDEASKRARKWNYQSIDCALVFGALLIRVNNAYVDTETTIYSSIWRNVRSWSLKTINTCIGSFSLFFRSIALSPLSYCSDSSKFMQQKESPFLYPSMPHSKAKRIESYRIN